MSELATVRLDKWLWAARFFKTRSLAQTAIENGRVFVNQERVKVAHLLKVGSELHIRHGEVARTVQVLRLSEQRGAAPIAQTLYEESAQSIQHREHQRDLRRFSTEPARSILDGRPTKRDRRVLDHVVKGF
jgi:ribosome-associated heat shock protein Hsp15